MRAVLLGFALGVWWLQQQADLPGWRGWGMCFLIFSVAVMARRRFGVRVFVLAAIVAGFAYAALRAEVRLQPHLPVEYEQRDIEMTGFVRGLPEPQEEGTRFLFEVEANGAGLRDFPHIVRLLWAPTAPLVAPALRAGQRWTLTARLKRPHANANFLLRDGEVSLLEQGIRATGSVSLTRAPRRLHADAIGPRLAIDRWRAHIRDRIETVLGDAPHRGIIVALAVGAQASVSDDDWAVMRATGTSHLVAISGLHIGFVAGLAALACGFVWRRIAWRGLPGPLWLATPKVAAFGAASFAAVYAALAGFNVPAQRTLWMLLVFAVAYVGGRRPASSLVLAWALALVLIVDPWAVTSPGFWLSFCAVAAILHAIAAYGRRASKARVDDDDDWLAGLEARDPILPDEVESVSNQAARPIAATSKRKRLASAWRRAAFKLHAHIKSSARVQYAVTLALAPLTAYWFSQIPLIGPLANAIAIPWTSFVVTPATLAGLILPAPIDAPAFHLAHAALSVLCDALARFADAGPAWFLWHLPQPTPFALVAALAGSAWALAPRGWPLRFAAPLTWLPLLAPAPAPHVAAHGAFRITALDIGQGSALVVETEKHALLFDAGPGPESTHAGERIVAPYLLAAGLHSLDALVISHSDSDHSGGAPAVLQSIGVRQLLASLPSSDGLWSNAGKRGSDTLRCAAGQRWTWDSVEFRVLWPDAGPLTGKPNHQACVLKVTNAAGRVALFTADIEADVERTLLARDPSALRADVLIVPHHGSRTSSTEPFLDSVGPLAAVFQVGYRNRFHHPNPTVYARYRMRGIALTRSDEDGAARIDMGSDIVLERFRQTHARYWMSQ
ncbi:ComEC/Rec2 family competence protein [Caballeronia concitans]|uniref:DNA internalization-related competence protein ComEC/Rec2 n=1 Tax=Caballeronia concitans TaxID=1777133 RepID=A0A658R2N0_9BURK|nr:ComEC/Rec2 family competence protein [Caballeronia concitans]KIG04647.1 ComEC/Rec2-related protein [Burkholderia sp. MR1]SAL42076.1 DNA internalization-related competence protein ComEC/Rec2 [Caballeronia concitans]